MAVANPCSHAEESNEWKEEMEENRKKRWRDMVKRAKDKRSVDAEEGDAEEDTEEDTDFEEEEEEGVQMREVENGVRRGVKEVVEAEDAVDVEDENRFEREVKGNEEENLQKGQEESKREVEEDNLENEDIDTMEEKDEERDNEVKRAMTDNDVHADEEMDVMGEELGNGAHWLANENGVMDEEEGKEQVQTGGGKEWKVKENGKIVGVEERELTETEEGVAGIREREGQWEVERKKELEEGAREGEKKLEVWSDEEVDEEEDRESGEEDELWEDVDWFEQEKQLEESDLRERFRRQRRFDCQDLELNQEDTMQDNRTRVNLFGSLKDDLKDSDLMGCDDEERNRAERSTEEPHKNQKGLEVPGCTWVACTSKAKREQGSETIGDETKSSAIQEEDSQADESTEDEDSEYSDEEEPDNEEDLVKNYCKDDYSADFFSILTKFKDSSVLTDLTLSTKDGKSFHVHSPVLACVSSLIRENLRKNVRNKRIYRRRHNDIISGISSWSMSLGPEVDHVGLEAVVEFAYTGLISCLRGNTVNKIKVAAQTLQAPRVLDLCTIEEEKPATLRRKMEEGVSAEEQMSISLECMKELWTNRVGCDVILEAVGGSLHVHRVILAVGSDYFRSMFTLGMRESNQPSVALPFLLASELEVMIGCSYSGSLPLSWKCVFELTCTAVQLQYQPVLPLCLSFLQQEINHHSCLDVASFAEAYEMAHLLDVADDFVLRQFQKVACTPKFKDLSANKLMKYLNSLSLCVSSEMVVFKAVVAWIQAKPKKRLKHAKELMKAIHFPLMTFKEFREVQSLNMWSQKNLAQLFEAIFEDFCSNGTRTQSQCRIYLPKESLVLVGGDQILEELGKRNVSRELWFGNSLRSHIGIRKAMEWRKLGEMPDSARFRHEVAMLNGQLYVFGGKKYYGTNDTLNSVLRYDPFQNTWENLAEMLDKRSAFSVVVLDEKMIAIGGQCEPYYWDSVEEYCPTANTWRFTWPLDLPLGGHVAKVFQGQIFVSGGMNNDYKCVSSLFVYHPKRGSTYLANMIRPRAYHCMETLGNFLYVAGGITTDANMTIIDQLACEVYSPAYDCWTVFTPLPGPHVGAGSAVLEGKFYVLGGYSLEDCTDMRTVHRYDPYTYRWENMGRMPGPNNDIRASLLSLPKHFRL